MDGDLQTIREVLSVHHVPVVASLHWDKLHSILHSLCDRIATQALRLERAEEQGKNFLGLKDELGQLCQNAVQEMKDVKESEMEQQQRWSQMVEERLQALQQGMDANTTAIKHLDGLDVPSCLSRLNALEEANEKLDRLDALEEATRNLEAIQASQPISLDSLNQKLEELLVDFEEQNEKLHTLEEQVLTATWLHIFVGTGYACSKTKESLHELKKAWLTNFGLGSCNFFSCTTLKNEKLKLQLDQMTKSHSSDLGALQQYCRNLRSDFELKFLVDVGKLPTAAEGEVSSSSKAKLEAAVAELQNRMQKKADVDDVDKIAQSAHVVKDAFEKIQSNVIELQSQFKRLSAGSRRATRVSFNCGLGYQDSQVSIAESKATPVEELSPKLVEELTKDVKTSIEKHDREILKVQKDFGMLGRSILILSGHQSEQLRVGSTTDPAEKLVKMLEGLGDNVPIVLPDTLDSKRNSKLFSGVMPDIAHNGSLQPSTAASLSARHTLVGLDEMDDNIVFETIGRLARYVKEQLQRPENALFTTKPLYGYKCMSCDHQVEKLSPIPGEHLPTNRMPPQVLPMLSAERIFAFDRRGSGSYNSAQFNKWTGSFSNGSSRSRRPSRRPTSPRKSTM